MDESIPKRLTTKQLAGMRDHLKSGRALTNEMIADLLDHLSIVEQSEQEWMDEAVAWRLEEDLLVIWTGCRTSYAAERYGNQKRTRKNFAERNTPKLCPRCRGKREFEVWTRDCGGAVVGQEWKPCERCEGTGMIVPVSS